MTYFELVSLLDQMLTGPRSDDYIKALNNAQIELNGDRYARFLSHLTYFINERLRTAMDKKVDKICDTVLSRDEVTIELNDLKQEIEYAKKIVNTKLIKEDNRKMYLDSILKNNNEIFETILDLYTEDEYRLVVQAYIQKEGVKNEL